MALKVIAFFLVTGTKNTSYDPQPFGGGPPSTIPPTTEPLTGTMAVDVTNGDILDFDFGGYKFTLSSPPSPYTQGQPETYFFLSLTNNANGATNFKGFEAGTFSVSDDPVVFAGGAERREFILIGGQTSPLVRVIVEWPDPITT
jgi:hypothetical protein